MTAETIDHEARATTIEISYNETGAISETDVRYLISQARHAIDLATAGNTMAQAGIKFIEASDAAIAELEGRLLIANITIEALKIALEQKEDADQ